MYSATTNNIQVSVEPRFLEDESDPDKSRFFWAYTIEIANDSESVVKLISRHWQIVDGVGRQEDVRGLGVVGEQPIIEPGDSYVYTSGCPLKTESGFMSGSYEMRREDGTEISVAIPPFSLDLPDAQRILN